MKKKKLSKPPSCKNCSNVIDFGSYSVKCAIDNKWENENSYCNYHKLTKQRNNGKAN